MRNDMPIKNYTTKIPANRSLSELTDLLQRNGATGIITDFDGGRVSSLIFKTVIDGNTMAFCMPLMWRECAEAIKCDATIPMAYRRRAKNDDDYAYCVALRQLRDWVEAQMTFIQLRMVTLPQVFLPYAMNRSGKTLYECFEKNPMLMLGDGK